MIGVLLFERLLGCVRPFAPDVIASPVEPVARATACYMRECIRTVNHLEPTCCDVHAVLGEFLLAVGTCYFKRIQAFQQWECIVG